MFHALLGGVVVLGSLVLPVMGEATYQDFELAPHRYFERTPTDRFTKLKADLEAGRITLDRSGEKAFLVDLLKLLDVPVSSQMLVFSTTSLQLRFISPSNPRALYFNEDVYLGYIPGGRIEIVSVDPELGAIFYIFDIPRGAAPIAVERSTRCMNCHAGEDTGFVPGLVVKSVIPGPTGGSLNSFRRGLTGHEIPLSDRFGGWHLTGNEGFTNHWGNLIGDMSSGTLVKKRNAPGERFDFARYPVATSDLLPQLLHEHQVGFVNRAAEANYRARTIRHLAKGELSAEQRAELDAQARILARYLLFADEAPLPPGGIEGDPAYRQDFLRGRREVDGESLKDFDLKSRLFRFRCSYMIHSAAFEGLPAEIRDRTLALVRRALDDTAIEPEFGYLGLAEKRSIRRILKATLMPLPEGW